MDSIWIEIVLIGVSILANAFFAGSEIALVSARPSRLSQLKSEGVAGAAEAAELKRDPDRFLATIQVAITVVGTLASAVGGAAAVEALTPRLQGSGLPGAESWGGPVSLGIVVLLISFVSLVIGELTPKALALRNPERWAAMVAVPIGRLVRVLSGPSRMLTWATRLILTGLGLRDAPIAPVVSEEEVKYLVREGTVQGVFEPGERDLVNRVFQFTDTPVRLVMVPRPNILGLDVATPSDQILKRAAEMGHTRLPVFRGSIEGTIGVVVIKDLFRCAALGEPVILDRLKNALPSSADDVDEQTISNHLYTSGWPDPDLLIRTAGEMRVSNYLLWQISYAELWVTPKFWPEFGTELLHEALRDYAKRERRYGGLKPEGVA